MSWKTYLKEFSIVMNTSANILQQVILASTSYIENLGLDEIDKQKLIAYIKDDVHIRKAYPQDIELYVKSIMTKLGM